MVEADPSERLKALAGISLFEGLSDASLEAVSAIASEMDAPAGQVLIEQKQAGAGLFVVLEGTVGVEAGGTRIELGPGEVVGELALLAPDAVRAARVRATTPVRCLAIARADFQKLLRSEPSIAIAMLGVLAQRLAKTAQR